MQKDKSETNCNKHQVAVLCSRIGGTVIGYKNADIEVRVAIDQNDLSTYVISKNHSDVNVFWQSIEKTKGNDLRYICREEVDILDVSIPTCYINNTKFKNLKEQSKFMLEIIRIVYETQPKIAVFHFDNRYNQGKHRFLVNEWMALMKQVGYDIHIETMKSSLYGIPNEKKWAFIIGVRKDIGIKPVFPEAPDENLSTKGAIGDLVDDNPDVVVSKTRLAYVKKYFYPGITLAEVKKITSDMDIPIHPTLYRRDKWNEPFFALNGTTTRPFHPIKERLLTVKEAMRLQTFPDDYVLTDNHSFNWIEICSSVPPNLIKSVAETLKSDILEYL